MSLPKCKHWKEYQAIRAPTCGCAYCLDYWTLRERLRKAEASRAYWESAIEEFLERSDNQKHANT